MSHRRIALIGAPIITAVALGVTTLAARGTAPAPNAAVRVLVYHDMEGLAGQDDWKTYLFSHPEKYPEGQKMLAADLNAVIDGLFAGGATQSDSLFMRWMDYESGRWKPPVPPPSSNKTFHGDR